MRQLLGDIATGIRIVDSCQRIKITGVESKARQRGGKFLEFGVARHEVGFGVEFDDRATRTIDSKRDKTFRGDASGFLGGGRKTLRAKPVDSGFHVAVGLGKGFLAVHHAGARLIAEFLHKCSSYAHCHVPVSSGFDLTMVLMRQTAPFPGRPP